MNTRNQTRKLAFEQVEGREMMAGNVAAEMWGDQLVIMGDEQSNVIEITEIGNSTVQIKATHGTTINGETLAYFYNGSDNLNIYMNGGDDTLIISSNLNRIATFNNVHVDMGGGKDYLGFWGTAVFGKTMVAMGDAWENDADTLYVGKNPFNSSATAQAFFWSNLDVLTGGGDDQVTFRQSNVYGDLTLITEDGKDSVLLERTLTYKNFYADLGNGDDKLNAWGLNARGSVTIDGGYGIDFFYGSANYLNPSKRGRFELHYN